MLDASEGRCVPAPRAAVLRADIRRGASGLSDHREDLSAAAKAVVLHLLLPFDVVSSSVSDVRLLAVQADSVFPSEVQDLWIKLGRSQTSSSAYAQWRGQSFKLWCVLLVDRSTQLPLTNQGYVLANTPARGAIVQIGGHRALYVGTGSSGIF